MPHNRSLLFVLLLAGAPLNLLLLGISLRSGSFWGASVSMLLWAVLLRLGGYANWRGLKEELARDEHLGSVERLYQEAQQEHLLSDYLRKLASALALEFDSDTLLSQIADEICELGYAGCSLFQIETDPE